jgi:hypothetical protein
MLLIVDHVEIDCSVVLCVLSECSVSWFGFPEPCARWNSRHGYAIDKILLWVSEDARPESAIVLCVSILSKGCPLHRLHPARWRPPRHSSHCLSPRPFRHLPFKDA